MGDPEPLGKLMSALGSLAEHLNETSGGFLCGEKPALIDCDVLSKLYVLGLAGVHFKGFPESDIPAVVQEYIKRGAELPGYAAGAYPKDTCVWGWGNARAS